MAKVYIIKKKKDTQSTRFFDHSKKHDYDVTLYASTKEKAMDLLEEWCAEEMEDIEQYHEKMYENKRTSKPRHNIIAHQVLNTSVPEKNGRLVFRKFYITEAELL